MGERLEAVWFDPGEYRVRLPVSVEILWRGEGHSTIKFWRSDKQQPDIRTVPDDQLYAIGSGAKSAVIACLGKVPADRIKRLKSQLTAAERTWAADVVAALEAPHDE